MIAEQDPFSAVRIAGKKNMQVPLSQNEAIAPAQMAEQAPQQISQQQSEEEPDDPFADVRLEPVPGVSGLYEGGRHATRLASRVLETIGGIPGDTHALIQSGVFAGLDKLTGTNTGEELKKELEPTRILPRTSELQQFSEEKSGGFTKPQNSLEQSGDEAVKTLSTLFGPMKFRRALGVTAGSQLAKEGLKFMGFGEGVQETGKLGTMLLLSLYNPGAALKFSEKQYDIANNLAKGASINAKQMEANLKKLQVNLEKGVTTSEKTSVLTPIKELIDKVKNGKIPVQELTAAKRDINKIMGDPATLKGARNQLKQLAKEVDTAIKPYEKLNPAFKKAYRPANEIHGAVMQGNKMSNFINRILGGKGLLVGALTGLTEAIAGHPEAIPATLGGAAGVVGGAKAIDFITRVAKSPELQKFYLKALQAAAAEDAAALRLYSDKIEKSMSK